MTKRGKFITVEGVDGAGKSTQFEVIANALKERGIDFVRTQRARRPAKRREDPRAFVE